MAPDLVTGGPQLTSAHRRSGYTSRQCVSQCQVHQAKGLTRVLASRGRGPPWTNLTHAATVSQKLITLGSPPGPESASTVISLGCFFNHLKHTEGWRGVGKHKTQQNQTKALPHPRNSWGPKTQMEEDAIEKKLFKGFKIASVSPETLQLVRWAASAKISQCCLCARAWPTM